MDKNNLVLKNCKKEINDLDDSLNQLNIHKALNLSRIIYKNMAAVSKDEDCHYITNKSTYGTMNIESLLNKDYKHISFMPYIHDLHSSIFNLALIIMYSDRFIKEHRWINVDLWVHYEPFKGSRSHYYYYQIASHVNFNKFLKYAFKQVDLEIALVKAIMTDVYNEMNGFYINTSSDGFADVREVPKKRHMPVNRYIRALNHVPRYHFNKYKNYLRYDQRQFRYFVYGKYHLRRLKRKHSPKVSIVNHHIAELLSLDGIYTRNNMSNFINMHIWKVF